MGRTCRICLICQNPKRYFKTAKVSPKFPSNQGFELATLWSLACFYNVYASCHPLDPKRGPWPKERTLDPKRAPWSQKPWACQGECVFYSNTCWWSSLMSPSSLWSSSCSLLISSQLCFTWLCSLTSWMLSCRIELNRFEFNWIEYGSIPIGKCVLQQSTGILGIQITYLSHSIQLLLQRRLLAGQTAVERAANREKIHQLERASTLAVACVLFLIGVVFHVLQWAGRSIHTEQTTLLCLTIQCSKLWNFKLVSSLVKKHFLKL